MTLPSEIDIELGQSGFDVSTPTCTFQNMPPLWKRYFSSLFRRSETCEVRKVQIEDFRQGYPRFSALIAAEDSFHIYRRFSNLRNRLILLKQDRLSLLEKQLERVDQEEKAVLFLGSSRCDTNGERSHVLSEIDTALADYDEMIERSHKMLIYESAKARDVLSLQNWIDGNACLARDETAYLEHGRELISLASASDGTAGRLESWIEDHLVRFHGAFGKGPSRDISRDSYVFIFSGSWSARAARALIASLIVVLLLSPVIICNSLGSMMLRIITIAIATVILIAVLSILTKAKTVEMFIAGTSYVAVLVVFISNIQQ